MQEFEKTLYAREFACNASLRKSLVKEFTEEQSDRNVINVSEGKSRITKMLAEELQELSKIILVSRDGVRRETALALQIQQEFADMLLHHSWGGKL